MLAQTHPAARADDVLLVRSLECVGGKKISCFVSNPGGFRGMLKLDCDNKGEAGEEVAPKSLFTTSDKVRKIPTVSKLSLSS